MPDPAVKRVVLVNIANVPMDTVAQRITTNEFDSSLDMRAQVISTIVKKNPKVQSWTGNKPPYGYLDWWPNSLWMNDAARPLQRPQRPQGDVAGDRPQARSTRCFMTALRSRRSFRSRCIQGSRNSPTRMR